MTSRCIPLFGPTVPMLALLLALLGCGGGQTGAADTPAQAPGYKTALSAATGTGITMGPPQTLVQPTSSTRLQASVSADMDSAGSWHLISGPAPAQITYPWDFNSPVTGLTLPGVYTFRLMVRERVSRSPHYGETTVTVNTAGGNQPPQVSAGTALTVQLPQNSVTLAGSASDPEGQPITLLWSKVSGGNAVLADPVALSTPVSALEAGVYQFNLSATDSLGASAQATVQVTVLAAAAGSPITMGPPQTLTLPTTSTRLAASVRADMDDAGSWYQTRGPVAVQIAYPWDFNSPVSGLSQPGVYGFRLMVRERVSRVAHTADTTITVLAQIDTNQPPTVNAGPNQVVQLPNNQVLLSGTAFDSDGDSLGLAWSQVSGGPATIVSPNAASTEVRGLVQGVHLFRLTATDGRGASAHSSVQVTVNAAPDGVGVTRLRPLGSTAAPFGYVEYLPAGYSAAGPHVPLLVVLHGALEVGNGTTDLNKVRVNGPNRQIDSNGMQIPMVILTPQTSQGSWGEEVGNVTRIDQLITYALQNYAVDPKRIYLTGLSLGGGGVWAYAKAYPLRLAAAVPICGFTSTPSSAEGAALVDAGLAVWAAHSVNDSVVDVKNTTNWLAAMAQRYGVAGGESPYTLSGTPFVWGITSTTTFYIDDAADAWKTVPGQVWRDVLGNAIVPKQFATFYPSGSGHGIWERMYGDPALYAWLLMQSR